MWSSCQPGPSAARVRPRIDPPRHARNVSLRRGNAKRTFLWSRRSAAGIASSCDLVSQRRWMPRLVDTELASSGEPDSGYRTPSCFLYLRTMDAFAPKRRYLGLQVATHEQELVSVVSFGGMNSHLGGRKGEDQPAVARIHRRESKDVSEEGAISGRVLAVDDYVGTKDPETC